MYISKLYVSLKGAVFDIAPKIDLYLPSPITFRLPYNDIERIDFDFDIVTNVQIVECELAPSSLHTHPLTLLYLVICY